MLYAALLVPAHGASIEKLMGEPVQNKSGLPIGFVDDFIVDVEGGRVLYVVVDAGEHYHTLPVRAIHKVTARNALQVDTELKGETARIDGGTSPHLRRAGRLIGDEIGLPGSNHRGTIYDVHFEPQSGIITQVVIATAEGERNFPARTLLEARIAPAMR
jgi:uncharacterized protein YrrD